MLFNSISFIVFFPIVVAAYFLIPFKARYLWLLTASYFFYMSWNPKYALLLLASTAITYFGARAIDYASNLNKSATLICRLKKGILIVSISLNLGILIYFKYLNFFMAVFCKIINALHISVSTPEFDILLPVGISFYTFQALGYLIDVFRGDIEPEKNFLRYSLFVSFFPQLVAGPIERSKNLLKQLKLTERFEFERFKEGLLLMLWGYFLKMVIADRISVFVDKIYDSPEKYVGLYIIVATFFFGFQIYCDFAGYSIIAVGAAKILGVNLMENFKSPYLATSVSEFWRNWHISLTSWFRDYIYIPLGGNRKGKTRTYVNIMVVFLISGLWHGASMAFVIWGGINGLYQVLGDVLEPLKGKMRSLVGVKKDSFGFRLYRTISTFVLVDFAWLFFRSGSVTKMCAILKSLFAFNPWVLFDGSLYKCGLNQKNVCLSIVCIVILIIADICKIKGIRIRERILAQDWLFQALFFSVSLVLILVFGVWGNSYDAKEFIYFQF